MKNYKLTLGAVMLFIVTSGSYANDVSNQVFLTNAGSEPYQLVENSGTSGEVTGPAVPPGSDQNLQFTINTGGECPMDTKTTTYNIQVLGEHRLVLCEFNFAVTVTNSEMLTGGTKTETTGCNTSNSTIQNAKVEPIQQYNNNTGDICSASWHGQDEVQNMYQSGQLKVTVSKSN